MKGSTSDTNDADGGLSVEGWLTTQSFGAGSRGLLRRGSVVGEWRVVAYLGSGLSAEVYRVTNIRFGQEGALKLLVDASRGLRERFIAEANAIRFLTLKALPRFMGSGEWNGTPYYVMEYLQPLPEPMPRRDVAGFMNKVAKAVQMLHEAGFIHRDLKPGNILTRTNGEPVLIDLGLIKRRSAVFSSRPSPSIPARSLPGRTPVSAPHAGFGTPARSAARYMAFLISRWQIRSRSSPSPRLSFCARAAPRNTSFPRRSTQLALVSRAPRLRRISIRSPVGFPSGYSGRSFGKSVSSICSTAYRYACP